MGQMNLLFLIQTIFNNSLTAIFEVVAEAYCSVVMFLDGDGYLDCDLHQPQGTMSTHGYGANDNHWFY